jgi:hypothetical protein
MADLQISTLRGLPRRVHGGFADFHAARIAEAKRSHPTLRAG